MAADLPEAELLAEPTIADLGAKVTEAWRDFARGRDPRPAGRRSP
jgi:hypothetical protein